jgi:hypothetical protein
MNVAVTDFAASMVAVQLFPLGVHGPVHPLSTHPGLAPAVSVTTVPPG